MAVREVLKYPQVEEIVLVDLDPEMTKLAAKLFFDTSFNTKIFWPVISGFAVAGLIAGGLITNKKLNSSQTQETENDLESGVENEDTPLINRAGP